MGDLLFSLQKVFNTISVMDLFGFVAPWCTFERDGRLGSCLKETRG